MIIEKRNYEIYVADNGSVFPSYIYANFCTHMSYQIPRYWENDTSWYIFLLWIHKLESFLAKFLLKEREEQKKKKERETKETHLCQKLEVDK